MQKEMVLVAGLTLLGTMAPLSQVTALEACYGVVVAGENECSTSVNACASHAPDDGLKDAYIYVPNGLCEKLVGGSLESS